MKAADFVVARKLADKLMASCAPNEHWDELASLTPEQCKALDMIALECSVCSHWFSTATIVDNGFRYYCKECAPRADEAT